MKFIDEVHRGRLVMIENCEDLFSGRVIDTAKPRPKPRLSLCVNHVS